MPDQTRITLTPQQIDQMSKDEFTNLLLKATKIEATFVVRRRDGSIKYDDPALAGTFHEENLR